MSVMYAFNDRLDGGRRRQGAVDRLDGGRLPPRDAVADLVAGEHRSSLLEDPRNLEVRTFDVRRVAQRARPVEAIAQHIVAHHVEDRDHLRGRRHVLDVERLELAR